jgi:hypothetical protein
MMRRNLIQIEHLILGIIVFIGSVRFLVSDYLPIMGDGALHAFLTESIVATGSLPPSSLYPPAFHLNAASFAFFAQDGYTFLPAVLGILNILIVYLFAKEITDSRSAPLIASFLVATFPFHLLLSSTFFMETTLIFLVFLTLYSHLRYFRTGKRSWLLLTGLFAGISIATKQIAYLLPFVVVVQHVILSLYRTRSLRSGPRIIKEVAWLAAVALLISMPFLYYFYATTGTIIDPGNPVTNVWPFSVGDIDQEATDLIYSSGLFKRAHFQPFVTLSRVVEFYNPSGYFYNIHFPEVLFVGLVLLGGLLLVRERREAVLYLLIFVAAYHIGLNFVQQPRQFLFLSMMAFVPMSAAILLPKLMHHQRFRKVASAGILAILVIPASYLYVDGIGDASLRYNSMGWLRTAEPFTNLIEAYEFVNQNSEPGDVLADPNSYEAQYYADRKTFWLSPRGGADFYLGIFYHDTERLNQSLIDNRVKFLMIIHRFVTSGDLNTHQFIRHEDYLFIQHSSLFRLAFETGGVEVYEFIYHGAGG